MDFFIASAYAQDAAPQGGLLSFLPLIVIFVVFYFLLIRPQMKRAKEHKALVSNLAKGDEVVTNGGLLGRITDVGESFVTVELADNVSVKLQKHAVANVMPKGTVKSA
jgi:preprotein translocase subunit YajC